MNEQELVRLVECAASKPDTFVISIRPDPVTQTEADVANLELQRRGSGSRIVAGITDYSLTCKVDP